MLAWCFMINSMLINASMAVMPVVEKMPAASGATTAAISADNDEYLVTAAVASQITQ